MNFSIPTSQQIGQKFHKLARILATIIVFTYVISRDVYELARVGIQNLAEIAYNAGYNTGTFIHTLNDKLAGISVIITNSDWTSLMTIINETFTPAPTPQPAFLHPLMTIADQLSDLTVKELRQITGAKSTKLRKQNLIEMAMAMAI